MTTGHRAYKFAELFSVIENIDYGMKRSGVWISWANKAPGRPKIVASTLTTIGVKKA